MSRPCRWYGSCARPPYEGKALTRSTAAVAADRFIGMRIRACRTMLGLSQRQVGELIGVTCQQVQKYESGADSVSAGRLYEIARGLGAPLESFLGLDRKEWRLPPRQRVLLAAARDFGEVQNEKYLEALNQFIRALAGRARPRARGARPRRADAVPGGGRTRCDAETWL
jgi:transcriptional regulator with XRE-family HTH domain